MNKKIFTFLLLAVFMLAQFSMASAATVAGDASITAIPTFAQATGIDVDWAVSGMAAGTKNVLMWAREFPAAAYSMTECQLVATINGTSDANGTYFYDFAATALALGNGDVAEFTITVDSDNCAGAPTLPAADSVMGSTTVDTAFPTLAILNPPSLSGAIFISQPVACNTFEMWGVASDHYGFPSTVGYSGFGDWNPQVTGTFAPPAPITAGESLLSWVNTFPATASGPWTFSVQPEDSAGNMSPSWGYRVSLVIDPTELEDCATFTDTSGHADETYIRYLADLDLISGFADGTFGPDTTLTRAEAATLFEISNGYDVASLPTSAPAGCEFTDVAASDWFAGWVWQACDDGYMNGVGGGLFDPNNLLTRGQIVTIMNNVGLAGPSGGYLNTANVINTLWFFPTPFRTAAWTDVSIGAFYAEPVVRAYGSGVADGTSDTTFSPDQPVTRGEFAKMLYRALSRYV
ncbi:S-layer homology domain-containing protein [Candidatus Villigracilis affinis]|uniref:S-layer homology domain-containing protein n=1 Tax=Candidatus Villigracilis affinis TaxID=3140682 RepID=UPI001E11C336|nr:S-layer homology domain-containing protein [Anaerolineales bacterium]